MKYIYRAQSCRLLLFYILFISSFILNVFLLVKEYIFTELDMELDGEFYSGFDPVAISDQISVFNHAKHREVECKYFTPSFNISVDRYPKLSELLKHVNFNRYNQLYNVGVYLIDTVRSNKRLNVLEVSGSNEILKTLLGKGNSFKKISYPEYNVLNLHKKIEANKYDWVILDQVLEHIENPFQAMIQLWRVLKPGGKLILLVPSFYVYHYGPWDYWRFTCDSLKVLVAPFESVELCGSYRSRDFVRLYIDKWPSLRKNNPFNPWKDAEVAQVLSAQPSIRHMRWERNSPKPYGAGSPVYGDYMISSWIVAKK